MSFSAVVCSVTDGDTIKVVPLGAARSLGVRIAGIDAPELNQPYGLQAKTELFKLLVGHQVDVRIIAEDKYRRQVGRIALTASQSDVGVLMVQGGLAWVYTQYAANLGWDCPKYIQAQQHAQRNKLGLWQDPNPIPPEQWRKQCKVNRNTLFQMLVPKFTWNPFPPK